MPVPTEQIDALFAAWDHDRSPGCVLAVIQDGVIAYQRAYGMADLERRVPLTVESAFDIGSIGKQFTAALIGLLAEQGALTLDDPIDRHVPELRDYGHQIRIRHLIHHISGLRDYTTIMYMAGMSFENSYTEAELLDMIFRQQQLDFTPGDAYLYSNSGYLLLGVIAQRVAGRPYLDLLREQILLPLGMHTTTFNDGYARIVPNRALSYNGDLASGLKTEIALAGGFGDGALISTVGDLARWDQNFYENRLGRGGQALIEQSLITGQLNDGAAIDYAHGLVVRSYRGLRTVGHSGGWAGYRSELLRFPDQRCTVICLANLGLIVPWELALRVADIWLVDQLSEPIEAPQTTAPAEPPPYTSPESLDAYAGIYRSEELGARYRVRIADGQLQLQRGWLAEHPLAPVAEDTFAGNDLMLRWVRGEQRQIVGLEVSQERTSAIRLTRE